MSRTPSRTNWTATRARRELETWKRSGESMAAFARKRKYSSKRLEYWRRRLGGETPPPPSLPVALAPAIVTTLGAAIVVSLGPDEVRLEVGEPSAVHPEWLAALITALREGGHA